MDKRGKPPDISVIVPTLDEAQNVDCLLTGLFAAFDRANLSIEVLFADGGSTDGTQERIRRWESKASVTLVKAQSGRGLTGDVLAAAGRASRSISRCPPATSAIFSPAITPGSWACRSTG